jgi:hypothetical protein
MVNEHTAVQKLLEVSAVCVLKDNLSVLQAMLTPAVTLALVAAAM